MYLEIKTNHQSRIYYLDTLELGHISAFLLGEASTLPVRSLRALCPWNSLALFLLHGLALPLVDLVALLLWHVPALLGCNIATLLLVVNLLANLLSHWVTFFSINSLAFAAWLILQKILLDQVKEASFGE